MPRSPSDLLHGEGVGVRPALIADLLRAPSAVDFVELTYEGHRSGHERREAVALAEVWPVAVHGIGLSLGAADGIDPARARALGDFARDTGAALLTEHAAFVRSQGRSLGHLTALPHHPAAVRAIARNLDLARRSFPDVPFAIENVAWTVRYPDDAMPEGAFYEAIVQRTGAPLLLDVANVHANAINAGVDPIAHVDAFPLERVAMIHVAGGMARDGFYYDTHGHETPEGVLELLAHVLARTGPVPIALERDEHLPTFAALRGELDRVHDARFGAGRVSVAPRTPPSRPAAPLFVDHDDVSDAAFAATQGAVAAWLQSGARPDRFEARWGEISRDVLLKKRVGDALGHLPRLARACAARVAAILASRPRGPGEEAIDEAARVAAALETDRAFGEAAARDGAALRARFVRDRRGAAPRLGPYLERVRAADGDAFWIFKPPGREARLRFFSARTEPSPSLEVR